jgi:hypothetical protein
MSLIGGYSIRPGMFKMCPSCQYIAMREHESTCPNCHGALAQRDLASAIGLESTLFAQPAHSDQPTTTISSDSCHFHGELSGNDWTLQSFTVPVLSQV